MSFGSTLLLVPWLRKGPAPLVGVSWNHGVIKRCDMRASLYTFMHEILAVAALTVSISVAPKPFGSNSVHPRNSVELPNPMKPFREL